MNDTMMTITGNLVESPKLRRTKNGLSVANFRVASTARRYDREKQQWIDGDTLFVTVSAWRALGENVAQSLHKGMPVIVTGRYYQREYTRDEMVRTSYELDATAVGPDLSRGTAVFRRSSRPAGGVTLDLDENGHPADVSHRFHEFVDDEAGAAAHDDAAVQVDRATGEVRELATAS